MDAYGLLQGVIVGAIVALSAWSVVRPWVRKRKAVSTATGCGNKSSSCGGCSGCGDANAKEQPIRFHH